MFACLMPPPAPKTVFTAGSVSELNAQTVFGSAWADGKAKFIVVPAGVFIGPLTIPTGLVGSLTVINEGEIQGLAGAPNGGDGGDAITAESSFSLINRGAVRGGGGAGGRGGTGGQGGSGSYVQTNDTGYINDSAYRWVDQYSQGGGDGEGSYTYSQIIWAGVEIGTTTNQSGPVTIGSYTYYKGTFISSGISWESHQIKRTWQSTVSTTGGAGGNGGNGGHGRGYGQSRTSGVAGAAGSPGGTNAGTGGQGGTGGTGGDWGSDGGDGSQGLTGANGNVSNGLAGASGESGGASGAAVNMISGTLTLDNTGTINGAVP